MRQCLGVTICSALLLLLIACTSGKTQERSVEAPIGPPAPQQNASAALPAKPLPPPTQGEVRDALQRVFGETLVTRSISQFMVGDFNGDASQDLAVVVVPNPAKLDELNSQLANWTIEDPRRAFLPPENKSVVQLPPKPAPEQVRKGETLLAIIHGYGPLGWRNPQARQAYLLRNSSGTRTTVADLPRQLMSRAGVVPGERNVIAEHIRGRNGFVFWTGATYAWHPL